MRTENGRVESIERSRHVETAAGETGSREMSSRRDGNAIVREGSIRTSTGIDADTAGVIRRTDDGFVARGVVSGERYAGAGTIVRSDGRTYVRGVATDGDRITAGRIHCNGNHCHGARVVADVNSYYYYPYYYYPYYYAYYACPAYGTTVVVGYYGTPVYSCSQVVVVSTTVVLSSADSNYLAGSGSGSEVSVQATSVPVVMYEVDPGTVVYATTYEPDDVYSTEDDGRYFWLPGAKKNTKDAKKSIEAAIEAEKPTANATVITYQMGDRLVYLTNEPPVEGTYSTHSEELFAWIAGVAEPSSKDRDAIAGALTAHGEGGSAALEREVRKLQESREPPPSAEAS